MLRSVRRHVPGLLLLLTVCVIGLWHAGDYGVAWDDPIQRDIGLTSYNYAVHGDTTLKTYQDRAYGVAFELVLIGLEKAVHSTDSRTTYRLRHFATHGFFLLGLAAGYWLAYRLFRSPALAALGIALLVLMPRIYAHSFFNTKDVPFLTAFLIVLALAHQAFATNRARWYLLLGIGCGYAAGIRILGLLPAGVVGLLLLVDLAAALRRRSGWGRPVRNGLLLGGGCAGALYACWPFLWDAPVQNLALAFRSFAHFSWNSDVLFAGTTYSASQLPWYYLPVWVAISTPPVWLVAALAGGIALTVQAVRAPRWALRDPAGKTMLLMLLCAAVPFGTVILLHSVVYDDWRHLYFTYPPMVLLALWGLRRAWAYRKGRLWMAGALAVQAATVLRFLIAAHPIQQVYFNGLVSHQPEALRTSYDFEYWGCAYRQGLEYLLQHDASDTVRVFDSLPPVGNGLLLLRPEQRRRIKLVDRGFTPYYFLTNYRGRNPKDRFDHPLVYTVRVLNSTALGVYRVVR